LAEDGALAPSGY